MPRKGTKIGNFLRKNKLDELAQLLNMLMGDIRVGPWPEVKKYVIPFKNEYETILSIQPGITDYSTLQYRSEQEVLSKYENTEDGYSKEILPAKIRLYNKYLREMSFPADPKIIFKTILALFS